MRILVRRNSHMKMYVKLNPNMVHTLYLIRKYLLSNSNTDVPAHKKITKQMVKSEKLHNTVNSPPTRIRLYPWK
jgi:hypothetical protein